MHDPVPDETVVKIETMLWGGVTAYFAVYRRDLRRCRWQRRRRDRAHVAAAFGGLVAGWSWRWSRRHPLRPSDRDEGDAIDDVGPTGIYPAASLRPLGVAAGMTIGALGVVLGSWMLAAGAALLASQVGLIVRDRDG